MHEFRSMVAEDLPLVRRWLGEPHVVQWWGKPEEQFDLVSIRAGFRKDRLVDTCDGSALLMVRDA